MYVAGFERGVRPIGDWSMSITLSRWSMPSTESCSPGFVRILCSRFAQRLVEDVVDERRLARAGHARDADEQAERELDVDALQVVLRAPRTVNEPRSSGPPLRDRDRLARPRGTAR